MGRPRTAPIIVDDVRNRLLASLGGEDRGRLLQAGGKVQLAVGDVLFRHDAPVDAVYFPESGVISLVASTEDGAQVESGVIGREGALGLVEVLSCSPMFPMATVQTTMSAWRIPAEICSAVFEKDPARAMVDHYAQAMLAEARESIACQAYHRLEPRLARWLLECRERGGLGDELHLTQEFMATMLGVQRTSVTAALASLEQRRLLRTGRGRVRIFDVPGLESAACECRRVIRIYRNEIGC